MKTTDALLTLLILLSVTASFGQDASEAAKTSDKPKTLA
jgi:hypothetical protein